MGRRRKEVYPYQPHGGKGSAYVEWTFAYAAHLKSLGLPHLGLLTRERTPVRCSCGEIAADIDGAAWFLCKHPPS